MTYGDVGVFAVCSRIKGYGGVGSGRIATAVLR